MRIIPVVSLDMPELEPYRTLREKTQHWQGGVFVAEGEKVVRRLIESDIDVISVLLSPSWLDVFRSALEHPRFHALDVYIASDEALESITGIVLHKKLMALGRIPPNQMPIELSVSKNAYRLHVALEGIADSENMGTIMRNCAAFGVESVITGRDSTNPWLRRSVRVSMGTVFSLRTHRAASLVETLGALRREMGWTVIGTTPRGGEKSFEHLLAHKKGPTCLLFGSEGGGLTSEALACCDGLYSIPMHGAVDSLNVANALAVVLYAAREALAGAQT